MTIAPVDGNNLINAAEAAAGVALGGTVSGLAANSTFQVTVTDNGVAKSYTATVDAVGTGWSATIPASDAVALANGAATVSAQVSDAYGNQSAPASQTATVAETAPTVATLTEVTSNGGDLDAGQTVTFTLTASEALTVAPGATLTLSNGGGTGRFVYTVAAGQDTSDLKVTGYGGSITDAAGNALVAGGIALDTGVKIDTTAPVVTIGSPAGTPMSLRRRSVARSISTTWVPRSRSTTMAARRRSSRRQFGGNGSWSTPVTLVSGANSLTAQVTDGAGNTGTSNTVVLTLNTVGPTGGTPVLAAASDWGVSNSDDITNVTAPTFTVALGATVVAGDTVQLLLNGLPLAHPVVHTVTAGDIGAGSVSLAVTAGDLGIDGSKSISAQLSDSFGNSNTTAALVITLDTTAPAAPTVARLADPANGGRCRLHGGHRGGGGGDGERGGAERRAAGRGLHQQPAGGSNLYGQGQCVHRHRDDRVLGDADRYGGQHLGRRHADAQPVDTTAPAAPTVGIGGSGERRSMPASRSHRAAVAVTVNGTALSGASWRRTSPRARPAGKTPIRPGAMRSPAPRRSWSRRR